MKGLTLYILPNIEHPYLGIMFFINKLYLKPNEQIINHLTFSSPLDEIFC